MKTKEEIIDALNQLGEPYYLFDRSDVQERANETGVTLTDEEANKIVEDILNNLYLYTVVNEEIDEKLEEFIQQ